MAQPKLPSDRPWSSIPFIRRPIGFVLLFLFIWPVALIIMWTGDLYYRHKGVVYLRSRLFKIGWTIGLLLYVSFMLAKVFGTAGPITVGDLPRCVDPAIKDKAEELVRKAARYNILSFEVKDVEYHPERGVRICGYQAVSALMGNEGLFTVTWTDKSRGRYIIEF